MKTPPPVTEKPYNACLSCLHRKQGRCDGPRTSGMKLLRWCEFMKALKDISGLTNAEVAERADVSIKTIERIMGQRCDQDIYRDTARRIEEVLFGCSNQYPCYLAFEESVPKADPTAVNEALRELERALADNDGYKRIIEGIHASYNTELQTIRDEAQRKIAFLQEQLDRLERMNDFLLAENTRKSRIVDTFLSNKFPELMAE